MLFLLLWLYRWQHIVLLASCFLASRLKSSCQRLAENAPKINHNQEIQERRSCHSAAVYKRLDTSYVYVDNCAVKVLFELEPSGRKSWGRPRKRWMDCAEENVHSAEISRYITAGRGRVSFHKIAGNSSQWKELVKPVSRCESDLSWVYLLINCYLQQQQQAILSIGITVSIVTCMLAVLCKVATFSRHQCVCSSVSLCVCPHNHLLHFP